VLDRGITGSDGWANTAYHSAANLALREVVAQAEIRAQEAQR
jgi:hypothetical protein